MSTIGVLTNTIQSGVISSITDPTVPVASTAPGTDQHPTVTAAIQVTDRVIDKIMQNPELVNKLNLEKYTESRVIVGNAVAALAPIFGPALGYAFTDAQQARATFIITALWLLGGLAYSTYGRLTASGPIRWPWSK